MQRAMTLRGSLTVMAIATAIAAGSVAVTSSADARTYRGYHYGHGFYGHAFAGAYGYYPRGYYPLVRMYAADHYYQRPLIGRSRVNNNLNPDFQLGGDYGQ
jgi:hypothetical protein